MRGQRGFTLVEMMIATAILTIIIVATLTTMSSMSSSVQVETMVAQSEQKGNKALERMAEALRSANIVGLPDAGSDNMSFRVPVDHDGDGDVLSDNVNLDIQWGAQREEVDLAGKTVEILGATTIFRYVVTGSFSEDGRVDLNRDGDTTDIFDVGRIEKIYAGGATTAYSGVPAVTYSQIVTPMVDSVVRLQGQMVGDIDNDGQPDPIFWQDGSTIRIILFLAKTGETEPLMVKVETAVELRNQ